MHLSQLLADLPDYTLDGPAGVEIAGLAFDSRCVEPGQLFVAYAGIDVDGHAFIPQAVARGAAAIAGERPRPAAVPPGVPYLRVPDGRVAKALLSAAWHGHPSRRMTVVGVTGTDGKTTTVSLLHSILTAAGHRAAMVSTVSAVIDGRSQDTGLHTTTPDAPEVQALLADMAAAGTEVAVLETTSHGLAQHRVTGVDFDVAVVTNVTHEHLDYHGSWAQYLADKARLFRALSTSWRKPGVPKAAVLNADDRSYEHLRPIPADVQLAYALEGEADVTAHDLRLEAAGMACIVRAPGGAFEVHSPLVERYNVYNILAATAAALALETPVAAIQRGVAAFGGVTGRMERIAEGQDFEAIVDFAHTPAALERALEALRAQTAGRVIVVFGCAGRRDVYKREMMGRVAGRLADISVLTAEDPRTEDLAAIIEQIAQGCEAAGAREACTTGAAESGDHLYYRVPDRGAAIALAVRLARPGDVVVAAGKGHERSMCFGAIEYPWSDQCAMRAALLERLGRPGEVSALWLPTSGAADGGVGAAASGDAGRA